MKAAPQEEVMLMSKPALNVLLTVYKRSTAATEDVWSQTWSPTAYRLIHPIFIVAGHPGPHVGSIDQPGRKSPGTAVAAKCVNRSLTSQQRVPGSRAL